MGLGGENRVRWTVTVLLTDGEDEDEEARGGAW